MTEISSGSCIVCGNPCIDPEDGGSKPDPHHFKTKGSGGEKTINLCHKHHVEVHNIGRDTFCYKYWGKPFSVMCVMWESEIEDFKLQESFLSGREV